MAVFDWQESSKVTLEEAPRVLRARFGDGYEQRAPDGINNRPQLWDLVFEQVDADVAADILTFLRARNGFEAFDWTPRWAPGAIRVKCEKWTRTGEGEGLSRIAARFEQVFEP